MSSLLDSVSLAPTCSEGEEETLVGMVLQQRLHSPPHPLIPLVDQLLSEVAVYFLCGHLLAGRQSHIVEIWDLREKGVTDKMVGGQRRRRGRSFIRDKK